MNYVSSQLETCHGHDAGVAWYAYFRQVPTKNDWKEAVRGAIGSLDIEPDDFKNMEEVPNALSQAAGFRRYYLGAGA